ncbi:MAG: cytochrome C [Nitrospirae bacterium]|nr:MAG: cytochrome C [Nitrospirota bacterium]
MKRAGYLIRLCAGFAVMCVTVSGVYAVPPGKFVEWKTPMGKVVFDGKVHADKGFECVRCHPAIFEQEKSADHFRMTDIKIRKFCGECHNGTEAFSATEGYNCKRCHKK